MQDSYFKSNMKFKAKYLHSKLMFNQIKKSHCETERVQFAWSQKRNIDTLSATGFS